MKTTKTKQLNITQTITMKEINKNTLTVLNSSAAQMESNNNKFIWFSLKPLLTEFNTYTTLKLRFRQTNANQSNAKVYLSTDNYLLQSEVYNTTILIEDNVTYREVDLTELFNNFYNETLYFAIVCKDDETCSIYTSSATTTANKPKLIGTYVEDGDFIKDQRYIQGSSNGTDKYRVNVRNGKMDYQLFLFNNNQEHLETNLKLCYSIDNTLSSLANGFPIGWKLNYNQFITGTSPTFYYYDGNYKKHKFVLADNLDESSTEKVYYDKEGTYLLMKVDESSSTSRYTIYDGTRYKLEFNSHGLLVKIKEQVNDTLFYQLNVTYDEDDRIKKITDGGGRETTIAYTNGLITITHPGGSVTSLSITNKNCLSYVQTPEHRIDLSYKEILGITKPNGTTTPSQYMLSSLESENNKVSFTYLNASSKIIHQIKEESKDENDNYEPIMAYRINFYGYRSKVVAYPYSNFTSNEGTLYFEYHFDESGQIYKVNELNYLDEILTTSINILSNVQTQTITDGCDYIDEVSDISVINSNRECMFDLDPTDEDVEDTGLYESHFEIQKSFYAIIDYELEDKGIHIANTDVLISLSLLTENNNLLQTKQISLVQRKHSQEFMFFKTDSKNVKFKIINTNPNVVINIKSCKVYSSSFDELQILSDNSNGASVTTLYDKNYYSMANLPLKYTYNNQDTTLLGTSMLSLSDVITNKEQLFISNCNEESTHIVWYNNGENMLANVSNFTVGTKEFKHLAILIFSGNLFFFQYKQYLYNHLEKTKKYITSSSSKCFVNSKTYRADTFDYFGNLLKSVDEKGTEIEYSYSNGNVVQVNTKNTLSNNGGNNVTQNVTRYYEYDYNRLKSECCKLNGNHIGLGYTYYLPTGNVNTIYDVSDSQNLISNSYSNNKLLKVNFYNKFTGENNQQVNKTTIRDFEYNDNNLTSIQDDNAIKYSFEYYKNGLIKSVKIGNKTFVSYKYDHIDGLDIKTISYEYGKTVTDDNLYIEQERITYNKYGNVLKVERKKIGQTDFEHYYEASYETKNTSTVSNQDFSNGRLTFIDGGFEYSYNYDSNKMLALKNEAGVKTTYEYGSSVIGNKIIRSSASKATSFCGEATKNETVLTAKMENKLVNVYEKTTEIDETSCIFRTENDEFDRKSKEETKLGDFTYNISFEYYLDNGNETNFLRKQIFTFGNNTENIEYKFNNRGLISEIDTAYGNLYYKYDNQGRIVEETNQLFHNRYRYYYDDNQNLIKKVKYDVSGSTEICLTDPYSSLSNFYPSSLTFEFGRLVGCDSIQYVYDIFGKRIKKIVDSTEIDYYYEDGKLMLQKTGTDKLMFLYGDNGIVGLLYKIIVNGEEEAKQYYLQKNILGDVIAIYYNENNEYKMACRYAYDAWGNHKIFDANGNEVTSPDHIGNINPIRYRGYYYDVETQLFYCNSRYYSPELCRWISPDSIEYLDPESINGLNLYAYCGNDPVNKYDPTGYSWESFWNGIGGKIVGTVLVVAAMVALTIVTAGVGTAVAGALGGGFLAAVAGGAVGGAISGAIFGVGISVISQGISNGYSNIDYGQVAIEGLIGMASGAATGAIFAGLGRGLGLLGKTKWAQRTLKNYDAFSKNYMFGSKSGNFTFLRNGKTFRLESSLQHGLHYHSLAAGTTAPQWQGIFKVTNSIAGLIGGSIGNVMY